MKENWQKENLEKSKEVLNEHFERRKQERERTFKQKHLAFRPQFTTLELYIDNEELDKIFEKSKKDFYDKLVWEDNTIEKKPFLKKIIEIKGSE